MKTKVLKGLLREALQLIEILESINSHIKYANCLYINLIRELKTKVKLMAENIDLKQKRIEFLEKTLETIELDLKGIEGPTLYYDSYINDDLKIIKKALGR